MSTKNKLVTEAACQNSWSEFAASRGCAPLVALPKDTDSETVAAVREAGYVPILTDDPDKLRIILPSAAVVAANDLLMSAMHGLGKGGYTTPQVKFFEELWKRMMEREAAHNE